MMAPSSSPLTGGCPCRTIHFVRAGMLDEPDSLAPDIHIFTSSKQPWVSLPAGIPAVPEF